MKKLILFLLCLCMGVYYSGAQSMMKVRVADNRQINLWIDGRYFPKRGASVTVGDLPTGMHMLKIYSIAQTRKGRAYQEVIYHGKVRTYRDMITMLYFDPYTNKIDAKDEYIDDYVKDYPPNKMGEWNGEQGGIAKGKYNDEVNAKKDVSPAQAGASPVTSGEPGTLTESKVDKLKTKIAAKKIDTERMNLLKDALNSETFTTGQVGVMMGWFGFESSKVEFAEWAYPKTTDKELYSELLTILTFDRYQQELEKFIQSQK